MLVLKFCSHASRRLATAFSWSSRRCKFRNVGSLATCSRCIPAISSSTPTREKRGLLRELLACRLSHGCGISVSVYSLRLAFSCRADHLSLSLLQITYAYATQCFLTVVSSSCKEFNVSMIAIEKKKKKDRC